MASVDNAGFFFFFFFDKKYGMFRVIGWVKKLNELLGNNEDDQWVNYKSLIMPAFHFCVISANLEE